MEDLTFGEQVKIILGRKGMTIKRLAELIEELLPLKRTAIRIEKDLEKGFDYRKITVEEIR